MFPTLLTIIFIILGIIGFISSIKKFIFHIFRDRSEDHYELLVRMSDYIKGYDISDFITKGNMKLYLKLKEKKRFYGFSSGNLLLQNPSGRINIILGQMENRTVYPLSLEINGRVKSSIDYNGQSYHSDESGQRVDYDQINIFATATYAIESLKSEGADKQLIEECLLTFKRLWMHNDLLNNGVILGYRGEDDQFVMIAVEYYGNFRDICTHAEELFDKQLEDYQTKRTTKSKDEAETASNDMETLLQTLELPENTHDLTTIKKQYRRLAKIYHPDMQGGSKERMIEINNAYEELCKLL